LAILKISLVIGLTALAACGTNVAADNAEKTPEQEARELMNAGKYQEAIDILEPLVEKEPDEHGRRPLLAAAYAGVSGVSVLDLVSAQFGSEDEDEDGDSVFNKVDDFLPEGYDRDEVDIVALAVEVLETIPEDLRGTEGDPEYGESAEFQLTLYRTVYATMYLNLFVTFTNGEIDLDALLEMSEEDAAAILRTLVEATRDSGEANEALSESIDDTLEDIDGAEGETDTERLQNFILESND